MKNTFFLLFMLIVKLTYSQIAFEDAEGKSSIVTQEGGTFRINFTENAAKIGYIDQTSSSPFRMGIIVSAKTSNGVGRLFDGSDVAPGATIQPLIGWRWILSDKPTINDTCSKSIVDDWITLTGGYSRDYYKLYFPGLEYQNQIVKKYYNGYSVDLSYNALFKKNILLGISLGYVKVNNYNDLSEVQIEDDITTYGSADTIRKITKSESLKEGPVLITNHFIQKLDIVFIPSIFSYRIGINLFLRGDYSFDTKIHSSKPGIGIFITEKGSPTKVIGGITFENNNEHMKIGVNAGFNFK